MPIVGTVEIPGCRLRVRRGGRLVFLLVDVRAWAPAGRVPRWERVYAESKRLTLEEARKLATALNAAAGIPS